MTETNIIAAIDLGSSQIVGMVGKKDASGVLSIIAYEMEKSDSCIRRGGVYNINDTAGKIIRLVRKLENKLKDVQIAKLYIGVGGQSLRTINHSVSKVLGSGVVTEEVLSELDQECCGYKPELLHVLEIVPPVYYLDNKQEDHPVGMGCSRIEAHYKLVVGQPALRNNVTVNMMNQNNIPWKVAGVVVAPLALAELILTEQEKEKGCALIDFGAGVTSVTMYKGGKLAGLYVIPLGSQLITRDLMTLNLSEREAERVKRTYGSALWEKDNGQQTVTVDMADGLHSGEIKLSDINQVVEARSREIMENIYARLEDAGVAKEPGYSLVIAGGGNTLKNLREALSERFKMEVRYASVRKDLIAEGEMIANNPDYMMAAALLRKGTENCAKLASQTEKKPEPVIDEKPVEPIVKPVPEEPKVDKPAEGNGSASGLSGKKAGGKKKDNKGPGLFDKLIERFGDALNDVE